MNDSAQEWIETAMGEEIERLKAEVYSDKCSCGAKHDQAGMAAIAAGKLPERGPDCRRLTWKEVAAQNLDTALQRRKEVRAALADLQAAQEERDHWKANHDQQVELKRKKHEQVESLLAERDRLREALERAKGNVHGPTHNCAFEDCQIPALGDELSCAELRSALAQHPDEAKA